MSYQLATLGIEHPLLVDSPSARSAFAEQIERLLDVRSSRFRTLWDYYENPMRRSPASGLSDQPYRQAQEWGIPSRIPSRITGQLAGDEPFHDAPLDTTRKEVVVENDIGWRIDTTNDLLFGRALVLESDAPDPERQHILTRLLRAILSANGGLGFLQRLALIGSVHGSVDICVKWLDPSDAPSTHDASPLGLGDQRDVPRSAINFRDLAARLRFELVEPARVLPLVDAADGSKLLAWAQAYRVPAGPDQAASPSSHATEPRARWLRRLLFPQADATQATMVEIFAPGRWQQYRNERLIAEGRLPDDLLPIVHVQNNVRPFQYDGGSDVEPLIPLQDRLNTLLSDRANRAAPLGMKMYLGVGIEGFADEPVQPGRMWSTDNPDARVEAFGGDSIAPSEEAAIRDLREALDKQSGVNPVAAGAIRNRVGNLTSAAALRLTFHALITRTERKRAVYGAAIVRLCELALHWLDATGQFPTTPDERHVRITWPELFPAGPTEQLEQAVQKQRLGIDPDVLKRELGY